MPEISADKLLATAVVDRGVDQIDATVKNGVEQTTSILVLNRWSARLSSQLHCPVAEDGYVGPGLA